MRTVVDEHPAKPYLATALTLLLVIAALGALHVSTRQDGVRVVQSDAQQEGGAGGTGQTRSVPVRGQSTVAPAVQSLSAPAGNEVSGEPSRRTLDVYLVGSPEQEEQTWFALNDAENIRHLLGEPASRYAVMLIRTEDEAHALRALGASDEVRATLGLPPMVVVDLRTP
jgi:hypothetical protein